MNIANNLKNFLFTSESVSAGHPDKICDQISDAILDLYLARDKNAKVAAEVMVTPKNVIICGETRGAEEITPDDIENITREIIKEIGYEQELFHWQKVNVLNFMIKQSQDIAMGVDAKSDENIGAGDQGIMFGYACDETDKLMPAPIYYAHKILRNIFEAIKKGEIKDLGPDAKSQVTLQYQNSTPIKAKSVVVSIQHKKHLNREDVINIIKPYVIAAFPNENWMCEDKDFYVNPTGQFIIGGPESDAGLTGRKIIVDTYGGACPHGGGAFSGKDPSKVDRSAAYMARYVAKNIVAARLAKRCTLQISYAIGVTKPLSLYVNTHGTSVVNEEELAKIIPLLVDLSPSGIIKHLDLKKPIYQPTASYGHFGRDVRKNGAFSWENLDLVYNLKSMFNL